METEHDWDRLGSDIERGSAKRRKKKFFQNYCEENIRDALEDIRSANLSCYAASRKYKIPYATLHGRLTEKHSSQHGKEPILSEEQEEELVSYVLECFEEGFPQQMADIMRAAAKIAFQNPDKSKHFSKGLPSTRWFHDFRQRHPEICRRKFQVLVEYRDNVYTDSMLCYSMHRLNIALLCQQSLIQ
jgi:Tc5 transposase DNA-binding domain/helix-turn-helix, Psq domain